MKIRLASYLQPDSIVDGKGIRTVIWTQGCIHNCPFCHNPETHDVNGGFEVEVDKIKKDISLLEGQTGITFSGGDPMMQSEACANIAKYARTLKLNIWCYTGYTFEKLLELSKEKNSILEFLNNIDVLVDGPFVISKKSYDVPFRGSTNQRLIDVKKSLEKKEVVLYELDDTKKENNNKKRKMYI